VFVRRRSGGDALQVAGLRQQLFYLRRLLVRLVRRCPRSVAHSSHRRHAVYQVGRSTDHVLSGVSIQRNARNAMNATHVRNASSSQ